MTTSKTSHLGYELNEEYSAKDIVQCPEYIDIAEVEKSRWMASKSEYTEEQNKISEILNSTNKKIRERIKATKQFYEYTKYPKIYKKTYWGQFETIKDPLYCNVDFNIINNRNEFVEEFNIDRKCKFTKKFFKNNAKFKDYMSNEPSVFDHIEAYRDKNNHYVIVVSPYGRCDDFLYDLGFTRLYNLYSHSSCSYVICLDKNTKYDQFQHRFKDFIHDFNEYEEDKNNCNHCNGTRRGYWSDDISGVCLECCCIDCEKLHKNCVCK